MIVLSFDLWSYSWFFWTSISLSPSLSLSFYLSLFLSETKCTFLVLNWHLFQNWLVTNWVMKTHTSFEKILFQLARFSAPLYGWKLKLVFWISCFNFQRFSVYVVCPSINYVTLSCATRNLTHHNNANKKTLRCV